MAVIHIKRLLLRAYIGFSDHEIGKLQDVCIDIRMEYDSHKAELSDNPADALDYKLVTKRIVELVESSRFNLLESLAAKVLADVMSNRLIVSASVEIDKPHALRFADSVSVFLTTSRNGI